MSHQTRSNSKPQNKHVVTVVPNLERTRLVSTCLYRRRVEACTQCGMYRFIAINCIDFKDRRENSLKIFDFFFFRKIDK